ncbi:hypothetical protein P6144_04415 [Sphingomonas sp. HITSZ_GF]|uniref:hypothetical protein n=1 Tax=Sphingomonas sp. HITSZ_GF TaxID=3037247 RepID=UPI00240DAAB9|nr:hypothetical protein [Sphingomonas sp. HITSZ_GF]MDG2532878.1 hypothetical protein [Sphingomonas sp. HITSZ_GF]
MILVSVMLAIYLGWPLAFGGKQRGLETPAEARSVAAAPVSTKAVKPASRAAVSTPASARPESCYKRYQREVKQCSGETTGAACKLGAADHWDMCEATGFWPE